MSTIGDLSSTSSWVKFFTESGIPQSVAANYAVTFSENRISKQMLLDLNKEILHDMGIDIMGDIIAILKYAKIVNAQLTRDKVFKGELYIAPVPPARRAVTGIARITTDVQSKVTNESRSQHNVPVKRLPVKRKVENEVTPSKKIRLVKEKSDPIVAQKSITVVRTRNTSSAAVSKPTVFHRLAGGATETDQLKAATVFDRLGPQHLLQSEKSIQVKATPQINKQKINMVNKNVSSSISTSNRKIIFNPPKISTSKQATQSCVMKNPVTFNQLFGSESSSKMKSLQNSNQKVTVRLGPKSITTSLSNYRGDSQGIFVSKANPIHERLGFNHLSLNIKKPSPLITGKMIRTSLRQDMVEPPRKRITFDTDRLGSLKSASAPKFVSTVSGSVFSRLGH